jgi:uncharacterized protein (TIGR03118 family)
MERRTIALSACLALVLMVGSHAAQAQYQLTNLSSNQVGKAGRIDPLLVNGWGLVHGPGSPWWLSDENSGWSTLYTSNGTARSLRVLIPTAKGGPDLAAGLNGPGSPTGIVFNATSEKGGSQEFQVGGWASAFLFATLDGTISGWSFLTNPNEAVIAVDNSASGAMYTGLAITNKPSGNFLYAADLANNKVDIFDATFKHVGSFTDSTLPAGFAPFGIRDINGLVYVTFASVSGAAGGFVEQFREDGTPVSPGKPLIHGAPLNQPWGIAGAPRNFGKFSNTLLIGNNTNSSTINAFDPFTGQFVGQMKDAKTGKPITIDQLWGIDFGDGLGSNGAANQLFFAAGPNGNLAGTFGVIVVK